jgi:aminoglycoside phosphotransferase family enzyme/predicted kinase
MSADEPDIIRDLLRPSAYGLPSGSEVRLRVTHSSWVFLTPDDVWKLKRPVDLGFLDFRTVEARRHDCEEELRLNQRLAPDVYLGVEPIRKTSAGHALSGEGPVVDWALHMRRLPDEDSAEALLGQDLLDADALGRVAAHVAEFLKQSRPVPRWGSPVILWQHLTENFDQLRPFVGDLLERSTLEQVREFQQGLLTMNWERFLARVAEDRIREGHGDLRLEHIYFLDGARGAAPPTIIDCIEFNEAFRCGDAAAEVAFLAMELEAAKRPDLAAGFVARFAEASDDFGLYGVLDFYLSYRAWVRGKVAAFVAGDPATPAEVRYRKREEARRYFGLSRSFSGAPVDRTFMIVVGGVIGSGKSTLAEALGRELAAPVVSSDVTRKRVAGLPLTARADASSYQQDQRERTYVEMLRRATEVLGSGRSVIVDGTFSLRRWRQMAAATAGAANAQFIFVEARCARPDCLRERLAARRQGGQVSDATDELLETFLAEYDPVCELDPGPQVAVDTGTTPRAALQEALDCLSALNVDVAQVRRTS